MRLKRPSPAMVVALLALFVALGGSSYAISQISGKQLKNRSVAAKKLKLNTLTGKEIRESRLGSVSHALRADSAASAANADRAGTAGNADKLDGEDAAGLRPQCPQGTTIFGGLCIELAARYPALNFYAAREICRSAGRMLISPGLLSGFRVVRTDDGPAPEWTDRYWIDGMDAWAVVIHPDGTTGSTSAILDSLPFRCAAAPTE